MFRFYSIHTQCSTLYKDQSEKPYLSILEELKEGKTFALVSDAGTPGISDPGSHLIRVVREKGFKVSPNSRSKRFDRTARGFRLAGKSIFVSRIFIRRKRKKKKSTLRMERIPRSDYDF
ncbi:hypothetical protein LEP1GSC170_1952 [Leptospira interrogans serovar Bataviae str. HAI135]|nr:hypothetical protein LEP1GSC170_1952 [Leptospira interrogans serovar Bataviae str. HAI135]